MLLFGMEHMFGIYDLRKNRRINQRKHEEKTALGKLFRGSLEHSHAVQENLHGKSLYLEINGQRSPGRSPQVEKQWLS